MLSRKNVPLYIALSIPVLMIILVAGFIYLPGIGQKPKYNFVYMSGNNIYYGYGQQEYTVSSGHLVKNLPAPTPTPPYNYKPPDNTVPHFYLYDVSQGTATEITFEQAQAYKLDSSNTSLDNYVLQQGNSGGGGFIFGGVPQDYGTWYIKGHNRSLKLNLKLSGNAPYYSNNFQFLGWVE